jgi:hypothetical protein
MFRSYDHHQAENILIDRITQLTTDPGFLWDPEIHYPFHKSPPPDSMLRNTNPEYTAKNK